MCVWWRRKFTIHGFWPNYCKDRSGREWPQFCSAEKLNLTVLKDLVPTLESEWPSLSNAGDSSFWEVGLPSSVSKSAEPCQVQSDWGSSVRSMGF